FRKRQQRLLGILLGFRWRRRDEQSELMEFGDARRIVSAQVHEVELLPVFARLPSQLDAKPVDEPDFEIGIEVEARHRTKPVLPELFERVLDRIACDELHIMKLDVRVRRPAAQIDQKQLWHCVWLIGYEATTIVFQSRSSRPRSGVKRPSTVSVS